MRTIASATSCEAQRGFCEKPKSRCFPIAAFVDAFDVGFDGVSVSFVEEVFELGVVARPAGIKPLADSVVAPPWVGAPL